MATYWENSCSFGLRYVSWYKCLIVSLVFSHLGIWSGNLFLIAPFPDLCLLVPFHTWLLFIRYEKVTSLKNINPNLKILLGVSGWNTVSLLGSWPNSKQFRTNFIDHTIAYLRQRNFDGIDLNWAGPTARRKRPVNRNIFTDMLQVRHLSLRMRKTTLGFRSGLTQTGLYIHKIRLDA